LRLVRFTVETLSQMEAPAFRAGVGDLGAKPVLSAIVASCSRERNS
jgi:hypothetical protein